MPELLSTRDALAKALDAHRFDPVGSICSCGKECGVVCDNLTHPEHLADALLTSGAAIDATALADDEALVAEVWGRLPAPLPVREYDVPFVLRALAAALSGRDA